jgi:hypothetical protein
MAMDYDPLARPKNRRWLTRSDATPLFIVVIALGASLWQLLWGKSQLLSLMYLASAWLFGWLIASEKMLRLESLFRSSPAAFFTIVILPTLLAMVLAYGVDEALDLDHLEQYTLTYKSSPQKFTAWKKTIQVGLLRTLDKGLLVRHAIDSRIEFIRWDSVELISRKPRDPNRQSPGCTLTGWFCEPQTEPASGVAPDSADSK